jgi:hypothetical protein
MVLEAMKRLLSHSVLFLALFVPACFAQEKVFDWVRANDEVVQLDPSDFRGGRVYHPGPNGGNMHVDIQAKHPVTVAMVAEQQWNAVAGHDLGGRLDFHCLREHIVSTIYTCELPPSQPMVLVMRDERQPSAVVRGVGAVLNGATGRKQYLSPNDVLVTYYRWACVNNCEEPHFQWTRLVKEKYEITAAPKIYSVLTAQWDGQQISVKVKSGIPLMVALVPAPYADQVYSDPGSFQQTIANSPCKQRGVQTLTFECTVNLVDGQQSLVLMPEPGANPFTHKKAEIEFDATECIANCNLLAPKQ